MKITTLNADCSSDDIVSAMREGGACIVRDVLSVDVLGDLDADLAPWIDQTPIGFEDFSGTSTKRTGALIARCPTVRPITTHPLILAAAKAFLGPYCERIQLNNTQVITLLPGQGAQPLHRDRLVWGGGGGGYIPMPIEPQFNAIWAVTDFTEENGATLMIPGSQTWDLERKATPEEIEQARMSRGSVLLYSGTVLHGGGTNASRAPRIGLNITYSLSWLRQEENQYISCPPHIARALDQDLTDLVGYTMGNYALGFCSNPDAAYDFSDIGSPEMAIGRFPRDASSSINAGADGAPEMRS